MLRKKEKERRKEKERERERRRSQRAADQESDEDTLRTAEEEASVGGLSCRIASLYSLLLNTGLPSL